jgi:tryptophanase
MRYVAESVIALYRERERLKGLRITYEAPLLRHFTARLEELSDAEAAAPAR